MSKGGICNVVFFRAHAHSQGLDTFQMNEARICQMPAPRDIKRLDSMDVLKRGARKRHLNAHHIISISENPPAIPFPPRLALRWGLGLALRFTCGT
jgi:hypothetical protein